MRRLIALVFIGSVLFYGFFQFYLFLKKRIVTSNFKAVTENRIGQWIGAKVKVDRIAIGLLKHISVSGLKIDRSQAKYPFLIGAEKVIVRYDFGNFFERDFYFPKNVFLDSPQLSIQGLRSPESWFDSPFFRSERKWTTHFELKGGKIELPWPVSREKLVLDKIEGKARPGIDRVFRLEFDSRLMGTASGKIKA